MTGLSEEGGKVATTLVESLKSSPLTLALVVFNIMFIVVIYLGTRDQRIHQEAFQNKLFEQQNKTMEMLYNCTPNKPGAKE